jgi:hypothetical protein
VPGMARDLIPRGGVWTLPWNTRRLGQRTNLPSLLAATKGKLVVGAPWILVSDHLSLGRRPDSSRPACDFLRSLPQANSAWDGSPEPLLLCVVGEAPGAPSREWAKVYNRCEVRQPKNKLCYKKRTRVKRSGPVPFQKSGFLCGGIPPSLSAPKPDGAEF